MEPQFDMTDMEQKAEDVSGFLKCFANSSRLLIMCQLAEGEKSVTQLMEATNIPQTSLSQHLSKLKAESIVDYRRDHRTLYYFIKGEQAQKFMASLYDIFCKNIQ